MTAAACGTAIRTPSSSRPSPGRASSTSSRRSASTSPGRFERVALLVPFDQGGILAELYALGSPLEREDTAEGVLIRAHLPHSLAERYAAFRLVPTGA